MDAERKLKNNYLTLSTNTMIKYVVYRIEYGADVDGRGPERWHCGELERFDTEEEACAFMETYHDYCEIVEEYE